MTKTTERNVGREGDPLNVETMESFLIGLAMKTVRAAGKVTVPMEEMLLESGAEVHIDVVNGEIVFTTKRDS